MPRARDHSDELPWAVLWVLVHGELPPEEARPPGSRGGFSDGMLDAFQLQGHYLRGGLDELRDLWSRHQHAIEEAADGARPWVAEVLEDADG